MLFVLCNELLHIYRVLCIYEQNLIIAFSVKNKKWTIPVAVALVFFSYLSQQNINKLNENALFLFEWHFILLIWIENKSKLKKTTSFSYQSWRSAGCFLRAEAVENSFQFTKRGSQFMKHVWRASARSFAHNSYHVQYNSENS